MIFHRGREMAHQDVGRAKMDRLLQELTDHVQNGIWASHGSQHLARVACAEKSAAAPAPAHRSLLAAARSLTKINSRKEIVKKNKKKKQLA